MTDTTFFSHAEILENQHTKEEAPHKFYNHKLDEVGPRRVRLRLLAARTADPVPWGLRCKQVGDDLSLCVDYSKYFTENGASEMVYGPCKPAARSMYPNLAEDLAYQKYNPRVRFATPDSNPLMPVKLRQLVMQQHQTSALGLLRHRPGSRTSSRASSRSSRASTANSRSRLGTANSSRLGTANSGTRRGRSQTHSVASSQAGSPQVRSQQGGTTPAPPPSPPAPPALAAAAETSQAGLVSSLASVGNSSLASGSDAGNVLDHEEGLAPGPSLELKTSLTHLDSWEYPRNKDPNSCLCLLCRSATGVKLCKINQSIKDALRDYVPRPGAYAFVQPQPRSLMTYSPSQLMGETNDFTTTDFSVTPSSVPNTARGAPTPRKTSNAGFRPRSSHYSDSGDAPSPVALSPLASKVTHGRGFIVSNLGSPSAFNGMNGEMDLFSDGDSLATKISHRMFAIDTVIQQNIRYDEKRAKLQDFQGLYKGMIKKALRKGVAVGEADEVYDDSDQLQLGSSIIQSLNTGAELSSLEDEISMADRPRAASLGERSRTSMSGRGVNPARKSTSSTMATMERTRVSVPEPMHSPRPSMDDVVVRVPGQLDETSLGSLSSDETLEEAAPGDPVGPTVRTDNMPADPDDK